MKGRFYITRFVRPDSSYISVPCSQGLMLEGKKSTWILGQFQAWPDMLNGMFNRSMRYMLKRRRYIIVQTYMMHSNAGPSCCEATGNEPPCLAGSHFTCQSGKECSERGNKTGRRLDDHLSWNVTWSVFPNLVDLFHMSIWEEANRKCLERPGPGKKTTQHRHLIRITAPVVSYEKLQFSTKLVRSQEKPSVLCSSFSSPSHATCWRQVCCGCIPSPCTMSKAQTQHWGGSEWSRQHSAFRQCRGGIWAPVSKGMPVCRDRGVTFCMRPAPAGDLNL